MRILMLAHRLPYPPTTGDRVRAYHVAQALAARHRLTLACPLEGGPEVAAARELQALIPDLEGVTLSPVRRRLSALAARVRQRAGAEQFDLIYVSSSSMAQYAPASVPLIMDFVDVDSEKFSR